MTYDQLLTNVDALTGTFVSELVHHHYPHAFILNVVIWPYDFGEVVVQHYNSVLTLSHLTRCSDAVLVLENEVATEVCRRLLHIKSPSFRELNGVIVRSLCMILLPTARRDDEDTAFGTFEDPMLASLARVSCHSVSGDCI
jgi:hypothetical protein